MKALHNRAARLFHICAAIISLYLLFTAIYAVNTLGSAYAQRLLFEMLHSAAISAFLAFGGTLLLDLDISAKN